MNAMLVLLIGAAVLVVGYIFYGGWLAKQWGVNADRVTPAHEFEDGVDYVPAKPYVVLGHHFSSIAGAGPINGPIQAAVFGWAPVLLWVLIGGIFFGAMHDFGALFASLRHKGQTLASVIQENIDDTAKKLFCIFAYLTLILVVAAFASIVAGTFAVVPNADGVVEMTGTNLANSRTAMISVLFIVAAVIWGVALRGRSIPGPVNIALAIVVIVAVVAIGYNFPVFELNNFTWMWIVGAYILVASIAPVWILLQPRDYLNSFLLYACIAFALVGIAIYQPSMQLPAFTTFDPSGKGTNPMFPMLFVTVACGAISGFHSLVSSGTTSKQLDSEGNAKLIGYGSMLLEGVLAVVAVVAVGYVGGDKLTELLKNGGPVNVFADGVGTFMTKLGFSFGVAKGFVALTISAFAMTTLDTATRLGRFIFQELFTKVDPKTGEAQGNVLTNPFVATLITVVLSGYMSLGSYLTIWPIFGAANQLLAALSLLAVGVWLKSVGRDNLMVLIPMAFMFCVTLVALAQIIFANMATHIITAALGSVLFILAIALFLESRKYLFGGAK